mmetsp:Transcript_27616/g.54163  ORF Transcript_27616/g.54163 Transcript_27616/m.54163 type:complete len:200 (-) Transcript_27616:54-653(-)
MLAPIGPQPPLVHFRRRCTEEMPEIPTTLEEPESDGVSDEDLVETHDGMSAKELPCHLDVTGLWHEVDSTVVALSPRSGQFKQKGGDRLQVSGRYELVPTLHNGAPCWKQIASSDCREARVLFRAADGKSWIIDDMLHDGDSDDPVLARMWSTAANPTDTAELWIPAALCVHPAGIHCQCACLKHLKNGDQATKLVNCC